MTLDEYLRSLRILSHTTGGSYTPCAGSTTYVSYLAHQRGERRPGT